MLLLLFKTCELLHTKRKEAALDLAVCMGTGTAL
jgi:hypothetical protein